MDASTTTKQNKRVAIAKFFCIIFAPLTFLCGFETIKVLGVFFIHFQRSFDASATLVSFTLSLPVSTVFLGGPIYGTVFNAFGGKWSYTLSALLMCCGYGICYFAQNIFHVQCGLSIFGVGAGINNIVTLTIVGRCFHNTRSLGMGACAVAGAICGAVGTPILQFLIDEFSWRGGMFILGAFTLNVIPCGLIAVQADQVIQSHKNFSRFRSVSSARFGTDVFRRNDSIITNKDVADDTSDTKNGFMIKNIESSTSTNQKLLVSKKHRKSFRRQASVVSAQVGNLMDASLLRDPVFIAYCVGVGITICTRILSGLYLVRFAQSEGIDDHSAATLISIVETASFVMIPTVSILTSIRYKKQLFIGKRKIVFKPPLRSVVLVVFQLIMAVVLLFPTIFSTSRGFVIYAGMLGLCYGGIAPLPNIVIIDLFGTERLAGAMGYRSLASGLSILTIPVLIGYLIDTFQTYKIAQYGATLLITIAGATTFIVQFLTATRQKKKCNNSI